MNVPDEHSVAAASLAVAEARLLTTSASLDAGTRLFELAGGLVLRSMAWAWIASGATRTDMPHDPVRWKHQAVGNYYLTQRLPPRHGAIL